MFRYAPLQVCVANIAPPVLYKATPWQVGEGLAPPVPLQVCVANIAPPVPLQVCVANIAPPAPLKKVAKEKL